MQAKITAAEMSKLLGLSLQAIHKQLKVKSLEFNKTQNRVYFGHETSKKLFNFKFKKQIIAFQIVKGGTGKTSLAHAVALRSNLYGAKVLCVDLDQQGNLTQAFGINAEELPVMIDVLQENMNINDVIFPIGPGLDIIPSRIENAILDNTIILKRFALDLIYKKKFEELKNKYDLILIDCPPAIGQSVTAATLTADTIIAPVTPEEFSLSGLKITSQELNSLEENYDIKIPLKIVLNKFDTRTSLSHEVLSILIKHPIYGEKLYKSYIRASQEFPNSISNGTSIFDTIKITSAKEDIDLLTREILQINRQIFDEQAGISLGSLEEFPKIIA